MGSATLHTLLILATFLGGIAVAETWIGRPSEAERLGQVTVWPSSSPEEGRQAMARWP